jgi:uncharacterized protein YfiM (DUF2279 family)
MMIRTNIVLFLVCISFWTQAQPADTAANVLTKRKIKILAISAGATYTAALIGLDQLWYAGSDRTSFRFFNDNAEWKQVDKMGHFYSAFHISAGSSRLLKSIGLKENKANLIGSISAFGILLPIEIFDGHSKAYGASLGDLAFNTAGAAFFFGQHAIWKEVRIQPKYSFHTTRYPKFRPEVLGNGFTEELLKDYNGQTYWMSVDVDKFTEFPKWLNFAAGFGAQRMVYARDHENISHGFPSPYRQFYLSFDWDLTAIKTRSKVVRTMLYFVNMIKLPAPALEFGSKGFRVHAFYF